MRKAEKKGVYLHSSMRHQRHGLGLLDGSNPSARITSSIDINSKFIFPRFRLHHQSNYPGSSAYLLQTIVSSLEEGPQITAYVNVDFPNCHSLGYFRRFLTVRGRSSRMSKTAVPVLIHPKSAPASSWRAARRYNKNTNCLDC